MEDIKPLGDPFNDSLKAEQILSVTEQVNNVKDYKNMSPEEKYYLLVTNKYNPFLESNFNEGQLSMASNTDLNAFRYPIQPPDANLSPTEN